MQYNQVSAVTYASADTLHKYDLRKIIQTQ